MPNPHRRLKIIFQWKVTKKNTCQPQKIVALFEKLDCRRIGIQCKLRNPGQEGIVSILFSRSSNAFSSEFWPFPIQNLVQLVCFWCFILQAYSIAFLLGQNWTGRCFLKWLNEEESTISSLFTRDLGKNVEKILVTHQFLERNIDAFALQHKVDCPKKLPNPCLELVRIFERGKREDFSLGKVPWYWFLDHFFLYLH